LPFLDILANDVEESEEGEEERVDLMNLSGSGRGKRTSKGLGGLGCSDGYPGAEEGRTREEDEEGAVAAVARVVSIFGRTEGKGCNFGSARYLGEGVEKPSARKELGEDAEVDADSDVGVWVR
jgi:hypothetical protein